MTVLVEVVSDVVCPWCFIGTANLEAALRSRADVPVDVVFRPFMLDASTPAAGDDLRARLRAKFGADPEPMFRRVESVARAAGLPLDFEKVRRWPSTLGAHTILRHVGATSAGHAAQRALAKAFFEAYFLEGSDIGAIEELVRIAAAHGVSDADARAWITDPAELEATREAALAEARRGVRGVPFFVFAGRYAVSGAQPPEVLAAALDRAREDAGA
ncbi:MAG: DsbA family oxidoreductase [Polyangiaceae bacterium]